MDIWPICTAMSLTHCARQSYIYHVHLFHHKTENKTPVVFLFLHNLLLTFRLWSIFGANDWTAEIKTGLHPSSAHGPAIFAPNMLHCFNPVGKLPTVKIPLSWIRIIWISSNLLCNTVNPLLWSGPQVGLSSEPGISLLYTIRVFLFKWNILGANWSRD